MHPSIISKRTDPFWHRGSDLPCSNSPMGLFTSSCFTFTFRLCQLFIAEDYRKSSASYGYNIVAAPDAEYATGEQTKLRQEVRPVVSLLSWNIVSKYPRSVGRGVLTAPQSQPNESSVCERLLHAIGPAPRDQPTGNRTSEPPDRRITKPPCNQNHPRPFPSHQPTAAKVISGNPSIKSSRPDCLQCYSISFGLTNRR